MPAAPPNTPANGMASTYPGQQDLFVEKATHAQLLMRLKHVQEEAGSAGRAPQHASQRHGQHSAGQQHSYVEQTTHAKLLMMLNNH